jgi:NAD(P)H-dependent flavin oxidoreductase YrpB (nitropropane dioxygenase family)
MKTRITDMLGVEYPILCGGMYRLNHPPLCAAISNAGAVGNLTATNWDSKEAFQAAFDETNELTDKPYWVNVTLLPAMDFGEDHYGMYFETIAENKPCAVEIGGVPLDRYKDGMYLKLLQDAGVKVIHKVGAMRHARHAQEAGYDALLCAGWEEGGHPLGDDVTAMVLTQRFVEEIEIPIIAVGGQGTGAGLAAALALGADGVMFASRFICVDECDVHIKAKEELVRREEFETTCYGKSTGLQGRALMNPSIEKVHKLEAEGADFGKILPHIAGKWGPNIWKDGDMSTGAVNVGQSIGLIHDIVSCKVLIDRIVKEATEALAKANKRMNG